MGLRVGIDLVSVGDVEASIDRYAERYLNRVYTPDELSECRATDGTLVTERLATRFAAKEALLKALRTDDEAIPWSDIAVRSGRFGAPSLELTGAAREAARRRGVRHVEVSLTHDGPLAAAVVVAEVGGAS